MRKNNFSHYVIYVLALTALAACETEWDQVTSDNTTDTTEEGEETDSSEANGENCETHEDDDDYVWDSSDVISITFNGNSITVNGDGASTDGTIVTITSAGNYSFSGSLSDGQIVVNTEDEETVRLILNGIDISNSSSAPIYIPNAEKVIIVLTDDTENSVTDGSSYVFDSSDDDEPNAAIFSKTDLTIYGNGSLTVDANYNDGITSKDGLIIKGGSIDINAVDDGIRGKDYLVVESGTITIDSGGDGLKSDNDEDDTKGYISIESGTFNITAGDDGMDAKTDVIISYGEITIDTEEESNSSYGETTSGKGIKGSVSVIIEDGNFDINSADDAIHSNNSISINGGTFSISSGDDGIHADSELGIYGGEITISKSYEGIESEVITIDDGDIHITSSDDGFNAAGGNDGSGISGWGSQGVSSSGSYCIYINGGYIYVNATGDGIDSNGSIVMTGGDVIIDGPTSSSNGALDYNSSFSISGGFLVATGSSGMAQAPGSSSSQYSVLVTLKSSQQSNTLFHIESSDGDDLLTIAPSKKYASVAFSSADLSEGSTYNVYYGGSSTGTKTDGLYENGTYTAGTEYTSFTISDMVTNVGSGNSSHNNGW